MNKTTGILTSITALVLMLGIPACVHTGGPEPWTSKPILDNSGDFNFVVFADRNGGNRAGVFTEAVKKTNLLQPAFAICVGDLIPGYSNDRKELSSEWDEFVSAVEKLDMRFFYVPGNHDIEKKKFPASMKEWNRRFGKRYYTFVYKNVMFMVLNSQEYKNSLGKKQTQWAIEQIKKYPEVDEIFVFLHKPLWLYKMSGFQKVMDALKKRNHTVFAGHNHFYKRYDINKQKYIHLAVTGGGKGKNSINSFDHIMRVTVRKGKRPFIACIKLSGIEYDYVVKDNILTLFGKISVIKKNKNSGKMTGDFDLCISNNLKNSVKYDIKVNTQGSEWKFSKTQYRGDLAAGKTVKIPFMLTGAQIPAPKVEVSFVVNRKKYSMKIDSGKFPHSTRPEYQITSFGGRINVDGKLDETAWKRKPVMANFRDKLTYNAADAESKVWMTYDKKYLYIAAYCSEPEMSKLLVKYKRRDGKIWHDDSMEVFIDANLDRKSYYQFIINPGNAVYDSKGRNSNFNADVKSAVVKKPDGWVYEMAIPWSDLKVASPAGKKIGMLFCRNRPGRETSTQEPLTGKNSHHVPECFSPVSMK